MAKTVADMTATELRQLVSSVVEEKLMQLLGDPDEKEKVILVHEVGHRSDIYK